MQYKLLNILNLVIRAIIVLKFKYPPPCFVLYNCQIRKGMDQYTAHAQERAQENKAYAQTIHALYLSGKILYDSTNL